MKLNTGMNLSVDLNKNGIYMMQLRQDRLQRSVDWMIYVQA